MIRNEVIADALDIQHRFSTAKPFRYVALDNFWSRMRAQSC